MNENDCACIIGLTTLANLAMQGMIAANQERASNGLARAYGEEDFAYEHQDLKVKLAQHMAVT